MKRLLLFILLLTAGIGFSQNLERDTLQLPEVRISNAKAAKAKEMKFRFKGGCRYLYCLTYDTELVTLVNTLPEGYLKSVTLSFNHGASSDEVRYDFVDTRLQLTFYEMDAHGKPGKELAKPIDVTVKGNENGRREILLPPFTIFNPGTMFVGLRRVTPAPPSNIRDFEVDGVCPDVHRYTSFRRNGNNAPWRNDGFMPAAYKMTIKEIVLPAK
ncbi:MAG: hypothetical protein ACLGH8_13185 [Bacteroidia bacterium]